MDSIITVREDLTEAEYNVIRAQHEATKRANPFREHAASIHSYREGESVIRQTYSHQKYGLTAVEEICRAGTVIGYRKLVHKSLAEDEAAC